nr:hypothetical protein [Pandoravirus massiliensis]
MAPTTPSSSASHAPSPNRAKKLKTQEKKKGKHTHTTTGAHVGHAGVPVRSFSQGGKKEGILHAMCPNKEGRACLPLFCWRRLGPFHVSARAPPCTALFFVFLFSSCTYFAHEREPNFLRRNFWHLVCVPPVCARTPRCAHTVTCRKSGKGQAPTARSFPIQTARGEGNAQKIVIKIVDLRAGVAPCGRLCFVALSRRRGAAHGRAERRMGRARAPGTARRGSGR